MTNSHSTLFLVKRFVFYRRIWVSYHLLNFYFLFLCALVNLIFQSSILIGYGFLLKKLWLLHFCSFFFLDLIKYIFLLDWSLMNFDFHSAFILFNSLSLSFSFIHSQSSKPFVSLIELFLHLKQLLLGNGRLLLSLNNFFIFAVNRFLS